MWYSPSWGPLYCSQAPTARRIPPAPPTRSSSPGGWSGLIPGLVAAPLFAGIGVAKRGAYVASIHDRAQEDARRRVDEERLRIARELHDVVAHTMATINGQAGAASHVLSTRPEAAAEAPQAIQAASQEGLKEPRPLPHLPPHARN